MLRMYIFYKNLLRRFTFYL